MTRTLLFSVTKADLTVQHFRSGGSGGQHQNTTDSGARIIHKASGARAESREQRSQLQNTRTALHRLAVHPRFLWWVHTEVQRLDTGKTAEQRVDELMHPNNIALEVRRDGKWVTVPYHSLTDVEADNYAELWTDQAGFKVATNNDAIEVSF